MIKISDGDNDYIIPEDLKQDFLNDCVYNFKEGTDEWYNACDKFDEKYDEYKI